MSRWAIAWRISLLWLCLSIVGVLAPVWGLLAIAYLSLQRSRERSSARWLARLLRRTQEGESPWPDFLQAFSDRAP